MWEMPQDILKLVLFVVVPCYSALGSWCKALYKYSILLLLLLLFLKCDESLGNFEEIGYLQIWYKMCGLQVNISHFWIVIEDVGNMDVFKQLIGNYVLHLGKFRTNFMLSFPTLFLTNKLVMCLGGNPLCRIKLIYECHTRFPCPSLHQYI